MTPVIPAGSEQMDRSSAANLLDKSQPPRQSDPYNEMCCSYMKFNHSKGVWFKVQIPQNISSGSKFVAKFPKSYPEEYVTCTVPQPDLMKASSCCMERGGGTDELLINYTVAAINPSTKEATPTTIVQALRVKKDNPMKCFLYLLPIPYLCILYPLYWTDMGSDGCCEQLDGLEWTHSIQQADIGTMTVVDAIRWERQFCSGSSGPDMSHL